MRKNMAQAAVHRILRSFAALRRLRMTEGDVSVVFVAALPRCTTCETHRAARRFRRQSQGKPFTRRRGERRRKSVTLFAFSASPREIVLVSGCGASAKVPS